MSAQPAAVLTAGAEPPPDNTEPSRYAVTSAAPAEPRSAWVIWPSLSSNDIRDMRSATRAGTERVGSW